MLYVFRYMKGFLRIRISGFSPERFMNLCSNHGIVLWDIFPGQCYYEMNISLSDFYRLKAVLRKTKTRVHILSKKGFPFVLVRWKSRKIFLSGFLFCFCLLIYLSTFICVCRKLGTDGTATQTAAYNYEGFTFRKPFMKQLFKYSAGKPESVKIQ